MLRLEQGPLEFSLCVWTDIIIKLRLADLIYRAMGLDRLLVLAATCPRGSSPQLSENL